ncbi:hypothetical protein HanRHA438_Chr05g0229341 [Helianthus annuus]|nr:hypothetical protein HanIR_Chr05g0237031 [Helianthus annuus]KAJ0919410.1 hypothetical protein HanRHA438_Chr05g0229341 [Helianthus annuus]
MFSNIVSWYITMFNISFWDKEIKKPPSIGVLVYHHIYIHKLTLLNFEANEQPNNACILLLNYISS